MTIVLADRNVITIYQPNLNIFKKIPIANDFSECGHAIDKYY